MSKRRSKASSVVASVTQQSRQSVSQSQTEYRKRPKATWAQTVRRHDELMTYSQLLEQKLKRTSWPLTISIISFWYWLQSNCTRYVRVSPLNSGFGSGPAVHTASLLYVFSHSVASMAWNTAALRNNVVVNSQTNCDHDAKLSIDLTLMQWSL